MMIPLDDPTAARVRAGSCEAKGRSARGRSRRVRRRAGSSAGAISQRVAAALGIDVVRWRISRPKPEFCALAPSRAASASRRVAVRSATAPSPVSSAMTQASARHRSASSIAQSTSTGFGTRSTRSFAPRPSRTGRGRGRRVRRPRPPRNRCAIQSTCRAVRRWPAPRAPGQSRSRRRDAAAPRGRAHAARRRPARRRAPASMAGSKPTSRPPGKRRGQARVDAGQGLAETVQRGRGAAGPMENSLCSCFVLIDSLSPATCQPPDFLHESEWLRESQVIHRIARNQHVLPCIFKLTYTIEPNE